MKNIISISVTFFIYTFPLPLSIMKLYKALITFLSDFAGLLCITIYKNRKAELSVIEVAESSSLRLDFQSILSMFLVLKNVVIKIKKLDLCNYC